MKKYLKHIISSTLWFDILCHNKKQKQNKKNKRYIKLADAVDRVTSIQVKEISKH